MTEASESRAVAATEAPKTPTRFEREFAEYLPQISAVLPAHISIDKFQRVVLTAVSQNPELIIADRRSLFNSCVMCAADGLVPDGREAALVIYNTKIRSANPADKPQYNKRVQYMPMIGGIRKRMRNSGEVRSAEAHVIYANDQFAYELGDSPKIMHRPAVGNRGPAIGAYAVIKLTNGEVLCEVMSKEEIESVRAVSRSKDRGPWVEWWTEQARKTVLRRCAKAAPGSSEIETLFQRTEDIEDAAPPLPPPRPQLQNYVTTPPVIEPTATADADAEYRESMGGWIETDDADVEETEQVGGSAVPPHADAPTLAPDAAAPTPAESAPDLQLPKTLSPKEVNDWAQERLADIAVLKNRQACKNYGDRLAGSVGRLARTEQFSDIADTLDRALLNRYDAVKT